MVLWGLYYLQDRVYGFVRSFRHNELVNIHHDDVIKSWHPVFTVIGGHDFINPRLFVIAGVREPTLFATWNQWEKLSTVCFSTHLPIYRRISSFLDNPHLPSFACDSKPYSTFRIWSFIVSDPLLKNFPIYPSVNSKCLTRIWRM